MWSLLSDNTSWWEKVDRFPQDISSPFRPFQGTKWKVKWNEVFQNFMYFFVMECFIV